MIRTLSLKHWSTYLGFVAWGVAGFMGQPTLASLVVHIGVMPIVLLVMIKLARHEGKADYVHSLRVPQ